jgi:hypothetical protein
VTAPILELIAPGAAPRRHELTRVLTTVGSAPQADLRLVGVPREWLVVQRDRERIAIRELATGARHELGELPLIIDGVSLALVGDEPALAIGPLAMALAQADDPASALAGLVDQAVSAAGADLGAVVLRDGDGHVVAVARDGRGEGLADGARSCPTRSWPRSWPTAARWRSPTSPTIHAWPRCRASSTWRSVR